jgi:CRP-like cAMP-binding protein
MRLDLADRDGAQFVQIVLPGDLLGLELLAAYPYAHTARAIVPCVARRRMLATDAERRLALLDGLMQQQRRGADLMALRTGPAQDRLKALLLMLAPGETPWAADAAHVALPTIKDIAALLDTAPETVSRIFANLRRSHIVDARQRKGASFNASRLRDLAWPAGMTRSDGAKRLAALAAT